MTLRIRNRGNVPRGTFWRYKQPETGETIKSHDWEAFIRAIKKHRRGYNIPVGLGFEAEIEAYVCEHQPGECEDWDPAEPKIERLGFDDVIRGTKVLLAVKAAALASKMFGTESPFVDQAEANRRASVCARCKFNTTFQKPCGRVCGELKTVVHDLIGDVSTPFDSDLKSCFICRCFTSGHVWIKLPWLNLGLDDEMRQKFLFARDKYGCWKWLPEWETESTPGLPA